MPPKTTRKKNFGSAIFKCVPSQHFVKQKQHRKAGMPLKKTMKKNFGHICITMSEYIAVKMIHISDTFLS